MMQRKHPDHSSVLGTSIDKIRENGFELTKRRSKRYPAKTTLPRHQLYGHLPPEHLPTKTIQVRRTRHAGHCWRSKDELISDVLQWTPTYNRAKAGRPARTYIQQLCEDTGCNPEDLPEAMSDREKWRERVRNTCAGSMSWWWWWWLRRVLENWKKLLLLGVQRKNTR